MRSVRAIRDLLAMYVVYKQRCPLQSLMFMLCGNSFHFQLELSTVSLISH